MTARWRDKKTWNRVGIVLTAAWIVFVAVESRGDPAHPLFDFVFLGPIALWMVIIVSTRLLGVREPDHGPDG